MKKNILPLLGILYAGMAFSQTVTVVDLTDLKPLAYATVFSNHPSATAITNERGQADLAAFRGADSIRFSYVGYFEKVMSYREVEERGFMVRLSERAYSMDEVVISASRFEEKREDVAQVIQVINAKELAFINQQTTADVLQNSGEVLVQKSQQGGGSPVIRGFEANRVLLVVDGVRMNNAIYRAGHLQNSITLDNTILEKAEIVFGPGSVVYGSDALGGVIHFHTKNPQLALENEKTNVSGQAFARFASASTELSSHIDLNLGWKKFGSLTSLTFSKFGDLRQGSRRIPPYPNFGARDFYVERINGLDSMVVNKDPNIQVGSGYSQFDVLQKFLYRPSDRVSHTLNLQYSTSSDVPRYDRLTQVSGGLPRFAEWYYGPQDRLLSSYMLNWNRASGLFDNFRLILAYQNIEESRNDRRFRQDLLNHRTEKLDILTLNADFNKDIKRHEIRFGLEGTYNKVNSTAYAENIVDGKTEALDTRYPDGGSNMRTAAAYVTHSFEISPHWILNEGIRFSCVGLSARFADKTFFDFPFTEAKQDHTALNGNLGLIYMPKGGWRVTVAGSSGFRAPNVDDLGKVFESVPGNVILPNPDLNPEYTYNLEAGLSKTFAGKITLGGTVYYTWYRNAITTQPGTFNGQDSILFNGVLSQVTYNVNSQHAYLYGGNAYLSADVTDQFSITSTLNYTYGRIRTDTTNYPLDHIPPVFGKTSFNLKLDKFRGEFWVMYNGWKRLEDYNLLGEDNFAFATPDGMPAWMTLNLRTSYQLSRYFQVQVALDNILDTNYRVFASNISAPGRNLVVTVRGTF
ncbi:MAG: TonB-dependent receptor [Lewinellaceae bacterium]|nr:TonB-dependent receptor [Lewinellaceae bacterium]